MGCDQVHWAIHGQWDGGCSQSSQNSTRECLAPAAANARMELFVPPLFGETPRSAARRVALQAITAQSGFAWPLLHGCVPDARGQAMAMGMVPAYPLGGQLLRGAFGRATHLVPLQVDYVMNPDLFIFLVLIALLVVVAKIWGYAGLGQASRVVAARAPLYDGVR